MFAPPVMSAPSPPVFPAPAYVPRQPTVPAVAPTQPKPVIRAQAPEEPRPARPPLLSLPAPEQLGVGDRPSANAVDWTAIHARMKTLGVVSFHMDKLSDGRARFICWLPGQRPDLLRHIESVAATEAEAVQQGLQEAAKTELRP